MKTNLLRFYIITYQSAQIKFPNSFFSNFLSQHLDIWYTAFTRGSILWDCLSSTSCKFFTLMVNNRNIINCSYTMEFEFRSVPYRLLVYQLSLSFDINGHW
jgi:hypothetical protein